MNPIAPLMTVSTTATSSEICSSDSGAPVDSLDFGSYVGHFGG